MPRASHRPAEALMVLLGDDVRARALQIENEGRIADLLWTRLLLLAIARSSGNTVQFIENPPYSPKVLSSTPFFTTISHTKSFVGAALSSKPIAIDIEVLREDRPLKAISNKVFGKSFWPGLPPKTRVRRFYEAWGAHECAVKLGEKLRIDGQTIRLEGKDDFEITYSSLDEVTLLTTACPKNESPELNRYVEETIRASLSV